MDLLLLAKSHTWSPTFRPLLFCFFTYNTHGPVWKCLQARLVVTCSSSRRRRRISLSLSLHTLHLHTLHLHTCSKDDVGRVPRKKVSLSRSHTHVFCLFLLVGLCTRERVGSGVILDFLFFFFKKCGQAKMGRTPPSVTGGWICDLHFCTSRCFSFLWKTCATTHLFLSSSPILYFSLKNFFSKCRRILN